MLIVIQNLNRPTCLKRRRTLKLFHNCMFAAALALLGASFGSIAHAGVSDDDIKTLVGEGSISKKTEECARLLGGLDKELYKDLPGDFSGQLMLSCRKSFKQWLDDPKRNPNGLTLSDIENKDFAERLTALRQEQTQKADAKRKQEQEQRKSDEAKKTEEIREKMQAAIEEGKRFVAEADTVIQAEISSLCNEWNELDKKMAASHNKERTTKPFICSSIGGGVPRFKTSVSNDIARMEKELAGGLKNALYMDSSNNYRSRELLSFHEQKKELQEGLQRVKQILKK